VPEAEAGLQYLEKKLTIFVQGPSQTYRNAALDLLIGREPDYRQPPIATAPDVAAESDGHANVSRPNISAWLKSSAAPVQRLRLVHTAPPQRLTWAASRRVLASALLAAVVLGVVLPARAVIEQISAAPMVIAEPAPVVQPTVLPAPPAAAPILEPAQVLAPVAPILVPTFVPAPEPTLARGPATPLPSGEFRLLLDERFGSNIRTWLDDAQGTAWLADGTYHLVPRDPGRFVAVSVPGTEGLQDVVLSADFRKVGGPAGGGYGVIVRDQTLAPRDGHSQVGRFYVFEVGDRGDIGVWLRDEDRWIDLLPWMPSDAVNPGRAANQLTVSAIGDRLSFMVNGVAVASQQDPLLLHGSVGVFAGGDGNDVALDRLTVRVSR
jgi:hypothetical protein